MTRRPAILLALACLLGVASLDAGAQDNDAEEPKITPPPPPEELKKGEEIEPSVTIVERDWATIQEYSVNGRVYAVRIEPNVGFPYWLYDTDGDGSLDARFESLRDVPETHQWRILEW